MKFICNRCQTPLQGQYWVRKRSGKSDLRFCSLQCNVENLESGPLPQDTEERLARETLIKEAKKQFKASQKLNPAAVKFKTNLGKKP